MAQLATEHDIVTLPKVELHVHLGGAISEATAVELARRHGEGPEALHLVHGHYPRTYPEFQGFLDAYMLANQFVRTPDDLELVAADFARAQAAQNVAYSEAIFTAMIYVRNGMDPAEMWAALRRGFAAAGPGTRVGLVVDAIRDFGPAEAQATVDLVAAADVDIVGLCLTGIEDNAPAALFRPFRDEATRLGMGFQAHAGEMGTPQGIRETLDLLAPDRIGHGVQAIRDPALLERLVEDQVPLDVCPSSNVGISLFPSLEAHPFTEFWRRGVNMTISSDDPPFFGVTLTEELGNVVRVAGLSRDDLAELQRRAMRVSFAPAEVKAEVVAAIDRWAAAG